jgi:hypothetical protein
MANVTVPDDELVVVDRDDSFDMQRQKNNIVAERQGIIGDLTTVDKSSLVAAINEVNAGVADELRRILVRAIAMS